jgi:hypothetical protein
MSWAEHVARLEDEKCLLQWTFGLCKRQGISLLAQRLLASEVCSVLLVLQRQSIEQCTISFHYVKHSPCNKKKLEVFKAVNVWILALWFMLWRRVAYKKTTKPHDTQDQNPGWKMFQIAVTHLKGTYLFMLCTHNSFVRWAVFENIDRNRFDFWYAPTIISLHNFRFKNPNTKFNWNQQFKDKTCGRTDRPPNYELIFCTSCQEWINLTWLCNFKQYICYSLVFIVALHISRIRPNNSQFACGRQFKTTFSDPLTRQGSYI